MRDFNHDWTGSNKEVSLDGQWFNHSEETARVNGDFLPLLEGMYDKDNSDWLKWPNSFTVLYMTPQEGVKAKTSKTHAVWKTLLNKSTLEKGTTVEEEREKERNVFLHLSHS